MEKKTENRINITEVVEKYHSMVFRIAVGFVHIREDAEDITQEVFIKIYQNREKFRGESEISTWLYRITVNTSLNFIAQKKRRGFLQFGDELLKNLFGKAGERKNLHQELEEAEEKAEIRKVIDSLPEKQRIAFILTRYDELPQKEVAEIMQISQRAVEQLLLRAKANLNKKMAPAIRNRK